MGIEKSESLLNAAILKEISVYECLCSVLIVSAQHIELLNKIYTLNLLKMFWDLWIIWT